MFARKTVTRDNQKTAYVKEITFALTQLKRLEPLYIKVQNHRLEMTSSSAALA